MKLGDVYYDEHADRVTVVEIAPDLMVEWVTVKSEVGNRFHIKKAELENNYTRMESNAGG